MYIFENKNLIIINNYIIIIMEYSNYDIDKHIEIGNQLCSNFEIDYINETNGYIYITLNDILDYTKKSEELISSIKPFNIDKKIKFKYFGSEITNAEGTKEQISFISNDWNDFRPIMFLLTK